MMTEPFMWMEEWTDLIDEAGYAKRVDFSNSFRKHVGETR